MKSSLGRVVLLGACALAACQQPPSDVPATFDAFPWEDAAPAPPDGGTGAEVGNPPGDAAAGDAGQGSEVGSEVGGAVEDGGLPPDPYSVIVLPDTQYYSSDFPQFFDDQARWIVQQRGVGKVAFVLGEGDIVDDDLPFQWQRASHSLHMLDGVVPYVLVAGNHDYEGAGWTSTRNSMINAYFPLSGFEDRSWFGGTFEPNHVENAYYLFDVPGDGRWLVLSLEFGPRDEVLAWANTVVKQHPQTPTIVTTHAYLYDDDLRYDFAMWGDRQKWNPHSYPIGTIPGATNDGEEMWQKLVADNSNIRFVLCGHVLNTGVGRLTSIRGDGSVVHQILANYQNYDLGGDGFLRVMQFFPAQHLLHIRTYSPSKDAFLTDPENDFVLEY